MTIGEFAKKHNVTPKLLRHYDDMGLLKPVAVDESSGYRRYSPEQSQLLRFILLLKSVGFSLTEVKDVLSDVGDAGKLLLALSRKRMEQAKVLSAVIERSIRLDALLSFLETEGFDMEKLTAYYTMRAEEITAYKEAIPALEHLVTQAEALVRNAVEGTTFGLCRVDLRHFEAFNTVDGYEVGDKIIVMVYRYFQEVVAGYNLNHAIARAGGDEFVIYLEGAPADIEAIVYDLKAHVNTIDYKKLGAHKPIDFYTSCVITQASAAVDMRDMLEETAVLLRRACPDITPSLEGVFIKQQHC